MAQDNSTLRLLIADDSQNEAERLVNLFRNAGHATRVLRIASHDELEQALAQVWDLLLIAPVCEQLDAETAIRTVRRHSDLPIIQLIADNDSEAITAALLVGAQDAVPQAEGERLILVAHRELASLEHRRARALAEAALEEAERRCQSLLESSADAVAYAHDGMHIHANRTYLELFGYEDANDLEGMPMVDLVAPAEQAGFKEFFRHYQARRDTADLQCHGIRADGTTFAAQIHFSPAIYDGEPCIQVSIRAEQEPSAELEERIRELSGIDPLTGLLNRHRFIERVNEALAERPSHAALALIRVDGFTNLQTDIGLADADRLLQALSDILRQQLGEAPALAHFGDDQFTVFWPDSGLQDVERKLSALLHRVEEHLFEASGRTVQATLSIGAADIDPRLARAEEWLDRAHRCADELAEGNGLRCYDPVAELAAAASRGDVLAVVRQALETKGFRLLFQPIISLRGDSHEHYEVLLRLLDPSGQEVPPADFLDAAVSAGLAAKIDRWVILRAIKLLNEHHAKGHRTRLFIHLSQASLQDASLLPWLQAALKAARLPADALVFQMTEGDATTYLKQAKGLAEGLVRLGCRLSLSQFGRSASPFNTFRHLPVHFVRIDGSFSQELARPDGCESLKALLAELHQQGKLSIVPFIESATMLAAIWQAGANYIQGYYLQAPSQSMDYDFSSDEE